MLLYSCSCLYASVNMPDTASESEALTVGLPTQAQETHVARLSSCAPRELDESNESCSIWLLGRSISAFRHA